MAHFARIEEDGTVSNVVRVHDSVENRGEDFLANTLGLGGRWVQTSYNANFRGKYAGIGDTYDEAADIFVAPVVETEPLEILVSESETQPMEITE
jgi:hypothetical protein